MGSKMIEVTSEEEQDFVTDNFCRGTGRDLWTGLVRVTGGDTNEDFLFLSGKHVSFSKWARDQPNNINRLEYCVIMSNGVNDNGSWHDVKCANNFSVICQRNLECTGEQEEDVYKALKKLQQNSKRKSKKFTIDTTAWVRLFLVVGSLLLAMSIVYFMMMGALRSTNIKENEATPSSKEKQLKAVQEKGIVNLSFAP